MTALLDTHVWLWYLLADSRLKTAHKAIIEDEQSDLRLSPISVWELHLLIEKKRVPVANADLWLSIAFTVLPVREAPLTFVIAQRSRRMQLPHEDPADRFIAATAAEMNIPLLTVDAVLLRCPEIQCVG